MRNPWFRNTGAGQQATFRSGDTTRSGQLFPGSLTTWPRRPCPLIPRGFPVPRTTGSAFHRLHNDRLELIRSALLPPTGVQNIRTDWIKYRGSSRPRFRSYKRSRGFFKSKLTLNPNDPLNLQDLVKETERRRVEGLSPLRGDSCLNTPALSCAGDMSVDSPRDQHLPSDSKVTPYHDSAFLKQITVRRLALGPSRFTRGVRRNSFRRERERQLPITGNYSDYYFRRNPNDRLSYLMPEWFAGKDVADYGCHNGTLTFGVLERFPEIRRIDAIDCNAELIANAKTMQRERLRWNADSGFRYDKINFQVGNWIDSSTPTEDPQYDTIMAFSVTKWIHLNHGDTGLMRFFRRAFNLLKPGGHLILEPQPKSSYRRTRFTSRQRSTFQTLKIDPAKLEPLLVDLGFSYFDTIKLPRQNEPFKRKIILCSKSYGATPASIRNDFRSEFQLWNLSPSPQTSAVREPPPVNYNPQTPLYPLGTPATVTSSPASEITQAYVVPCTRPAPSIRLTITSAEPGSTGSTQEAPCEPDSTTLS